MTLEKEAQTRQQFARVYERTQDDIRRYAIRLCRDPHEAEDLTQETYLRAFASFATFRRGQPILHWLRRIVRNLFIDSQRSRHARVNALSLDRGDPEGNEIVVADRGPTPDRWLEARTIDPKIQTAIADLNPSQRRLLWLAHVEERSHEEIAAEMHICRGTVKSRLSRLHQHIRKAVS